MKEPNAESKQSAFEESLTRRRNGRSDSHVYEYPQAAFSSIKSSPWVYNLSSSLRDLFSELGPLEKFAEPRQGLATADNPRFIRNWWEVHRTDIRFGCESLNECLSAPEKWYPHMKGGGSTRWYGQQRSIINYGQNGTELKAWADPLYGNSGWSRIIKSTDKYFHPGITYTAVSGKTFSCRIMPQGFCFDSAGDCLFVEAAGKTQWFLGLLNSKFIRGLMTTLNPTLNVNVLDLRRLPIPDEADSALLAKHAGKAVDLVRDFSREDETTYDFVAPPGWADGTERIANRNRDLAKLESEMDDEVFESTPYRQKTGATSKSSFQLPLRLMLTTRKRYRSPPMSLRKSRRPSLYRNET